MDLNHSLKCSTYIRVMVVNIMLQICKVPSDVQRDSNGNSSFLKPMKYGLGNEVFRMALFNL